MLDGLSWFGTVPLAAGATAGGITESATATASALALNIAEVSGSVSVTVLGELSTAPAAAAAAPTPAAGHTVQIFSTVVIRMLGVWIAVAPGRVQPQWVVEKIVVLVV
jgi:hypothetical protein